MKNSIFISLTVILTMCLLLPVSSVFAKKKPNGKPFLAIQEQFVEVELQIEDMQEQINLLMTNVTNIEERLEVNEQFIADLQAENQIIKDDLTDLQAQADANGTQIDMNSAEIQNVIAKLTANSAKIQFLENQVEDINNTLLTKQDILDGNCEDGYYLQQIDPDGGIICGKGETGSDGIDRYVVTHTSIMEAKYNVCLEYWLGICVRSETYFPEYSKFNYCPSGYDIAGGGFNVSHNGFDVAIDITAPFYNGWRVHLNNYSDTDLAVISYANCIKLSQ